MRKRTLYLCAYLPITVADSPKIGAFVSYEISVGWPADKNPESQDPGERPSATVKAIEIYRGGKKISFNLQCPSLRITLERLERQLIEAFQCP